jgi:hypothetical protein
VKTYRLSRLNKSGLEHSLGFYPEASGLELCVREARARALLNPPATDDLVRLRAGSEPHRISSRRIDHRGFEFDHAADLDRALRHPERAGPELLRAWPVRTRAALLRPRASGRVRYPIGRQ